MEFPSFPAFRPTICSGSDKPGDEPEIILPPPGNIVVPSKTFALTDEETEILARLEEKERIVRARIRTIGLPGYAGVRGFFFYGDPGHGKSFLLRTELDELFGSGKWLLYNSDMSPPALLAEMALHCQMPLVLEECEQLTDNRKNQGILRSAMAPPHRVNPENMKVEYDFIFRAPIYIASNLPLNLRHGVLAAIASRSGPVRWQLTRHELAVRMKTIALNEGGGLTVEERWEVAEYCIEKLFTGGRAIFRTLCDVGFPTRLQHKEGNLSIDWRDYIDSHVDGTADPNPERRAERIDRERHMPARSILTRTIPTSDIGCGKNRLRGSEDRLP